MSQIDISEWTDDHEPHYPTDAALERIKAWPHHDLAGCLDFVAAIWTWPEFGVTNDLRPYEREMIGPNDGDRFLRLATGGWSGNEDIVGCMEQNLMLRARCWVLSARGGLEIWQYPTEANE